LRRDDDQVALRLGRFFCQTLGAPDFGGGRFDGRKVSDKPRLLLEPFIGNAGDGCGSGAAHLAARARDDWRLVRAL
jgi:hypothetical protein